MPDYADLYHRLIVVQRETIESLREVLEKLVQVDQRVEELYMNSPDTNVVVLKRKESTGEK